MGRVESPRAEGRALEPSVTSACQLRGSGSSGKPSSCLGVIGGVDCIKQGIAADVIEVGMGIHHNDRQAGELLHHLADIPHAETGIHQQSLFAAGDAIGDDLLLQMPGLIDGIQIRLESGRPRTRPSVTGTRSSDAYAGRGRASYQCSGCMALSGFCTAVSCMSATSFREFMYNYTILPGDCQPLFPRFPGGKSTKSPGNIPLFPRSLPKECIKTADIQYICISAA